MNKPITIKYEEFKKQLTDVINQSGLPAFVIGLILRDYLDEAKAVANQQYLEDQKRYLEKQQNEKVGE